jgi:meso-butanediol dehydrogenase/(S,S)-butanediol dehydrogenase/diacetyl reductase
MAFDLAGQAAMVTGAGRGIGRGVALALAGWGVRVAVSDIDGDNAAATLAAIEAAGGEGLAHTLDVTDADAVARTAAECDNAFGGIDLLFANAGVLSVVRVVDMDPAEWRRVLEVNATGVFIAAQAVARLMIGRGRPASIVCTSSISGKRGGDGYAHYTASKFAVIGLVQSLAMELAENDILVNAVCPGVIETEMVAKMSIEAKTPVSKWIGDQLVKRPQMPDDIARMVAFLHTSRAITGQAINVDGGTVFH